jgi:hypothetical protein
MVPRRPLTSVFCGLLTMVGVGLAACDKVPLVAPAGTVITLVSSTNVLPVNGSTDLVAVLIENGTTSTGTGTGTATTTASSGTAVHNGTLVSFTTSLGAIEPAEARTHNGRVTVKLTADGRSGRATVTAFSGSAKQTLEVVIGGAAAERVAVTTNPSQLGANGGQAVVSARVEDINGNPLTGVPVVFTTTAGTLSASSGLTGQGGVATVTLSTTAEATVTASAGGKVGTAIVRLRPRSGVTVVAPTGVFVGAPATFDVTVATGSDFSSVVIQFGDGSSRDLGALNAPTKVTYTYSSADTFPVRVVGIDRDGAVTNHATDVSIIGFLPLMGCSPASVSPGSVTTCTVSGVPTTVEIDRYEWEFFGTDGAKVTSGPSQSHAFQQRGERTVKVTIVPRRGPSHTRQVFVTVAGA